MCRIYNLVLVLFSLRSTLSAALKKFTVAYQPETFENY